MIEQLLIDFADRFPHSQLSAPFTDLAAPALSSDEDYEPLWKRVNRICDQHLLNSPSRSRTATPIVLCLSEQSEANSRQELHQRITSRNTKRGVIPPPMR